MAALALEATALLAVEMTMFLPFGLSIHLGTIAVSVVVTVVLVVGFVAHGRTIHRLSDEAWGLG